MSGNNSNSTLFKKGRPDKFDREFAPLMEMDRHKRTLNIARNVEAVARERLEGLIANETINKIPADFDMESQFARRHAAYTEAGAALDKTKLMLDKWEELSTSTKTSVVKKRKEIANVLVGIFPRVEVRLTQLESEVTLRGNRLEAENKALAAENLALKTASAGNTAPSEVVSKLDNLLGALNNKSSNKQIEDATRTLTELNEKLTVQLDAKADTIGQQRVNIRNLTSEKTVLVEKVNRLEKNVEDARLKKEEMEASISSKDTRIAKLEEQLQSARSAVDDAESALDNAQRIAREKAEGFAALESEVVLLKARLDAPRLVDPNEMRALNDQFTLRYQCDAAIKQKDAMKLTMQEAEGKAKEKEALRKNAMDTVRSLETKVWELGTTANREATKFEKLGNDLEILTTWAEEAREALNENETALVNLQGEVDEQAAEIRNLLGECQRLGPFEGESARLQPFEQEALRLRPLEAQVQTLTMNAQNFDDQKQAWEREEKRLVPFEAEVLRLRPLEQQVKTLTLNAQTSQQEKEGWNQERRRLEHFESEVKLLKLQVQTLYSNAEKSKSDYDRLKSIHDRCLQPPAPGRSATPSRGQINPGHRQDVPVSSIEGRRQVRPLQRRESSESLHSQGSPGGYLPGQYIAPAPWRASHTPGYQPISPQPQILMSPSARQYGHQELGPGYQHPGYQQPGPQFNQPGFQPPLAPGFSQFQGPPMGYGSPQPHPQAPFYPPGPERQSSVQPSQSRPSPSPAAGGPRYQFLINGTIPAANFANTVSPGLVAKMDGQIAKWSESTAKGVWSRYSPSSMIRCVHTRRAGFNKDKAPPADFANGHVACQKCIDTGSLCVLVPESGLPVVLPLPAHLRSHGANPSNGVYFCTS